MTLAFTDPDQLVRRDLVRMHAASSQVAIYVAHRQLAASVLELVTLRKLLRREVAQTPAAAPGRDSLLAVLVRVNDVLTESAQVMNLAALEPAEHVAVPIPIRQFPHHDHAEEHQ